MIRFFFLAREPKQGCQGEEREASRRAERRRVSTR